MNKQKNARKTFPSSFGSLYSDAQRFNEAFTDNVLADAMTPHLPATFAADFAAQIDAVTQQVLAHGRALGSARGLTQAQRDKLRDLRTVVGGARRAARKAFRGQDALLRDEFRVGLRPKTFGDVLLGARQTHDACTTHAAALESFGWSAAANTSLASAIDAFADAIVGSSKGSDVKEGLTGSRNLAANGLYEQCRTLQSVAEMVFPAHKALTDASVTEARARFLLGEFPRRKARGTESPEPAAPTNAAPPATAS